MHGTCIKIIDAQHEKMCNSYTNTKLKLLKMNAAILFNKMCNITKSCICNAYVTWQSIDYKLPEDDTIVSKHEGV